MEEFSGWGSLQWCAFTPGIVSFCKKKHEPDIVTNGSIFRLTRLLYLCQNFTTKRGDSPEPFIYFYFISIQMAE